MLRPAADEDTDLRDKRNRRHIERRTYSMPTIGSLTLMLDHAEASQMQSPIFGKFEYLKQIFINIIIIISITLFMCRLFPDRVCSMRNTRSRINCWLILEVLVPLGLQLLKLSV